MAWRAVTASARVEREVILMPERTLLLLEGEAEYYKEGIAYSASNWLGRMRSAW